MRAALSLPLVGAAVITASAVFLGLFRSSARELVPSRPSSIPLAAPRPLVDRLRERGF